MKNMMVLGSLRIFALSLTLLGLASLAGADDKNKNSTSAPPPPPQRSAPQASRPAPQPSRPSPAVRTPQTSRPNYSPAPRSNSNPSPRPTPTPQQQGGRSFGNNGYQGGTANGNRGTGNGTSHNGQVGQGTGTGRFGNTSNRPPNATGGSRFGAGNNASSRTNNTIGPARGSAASASYRPAPRNERVIGDKRVAFDRSGRMRDIHAGGMEVHRTMNRQRTFVVQQNGRRIVGLGPNRGYVQRTYVSRYGRTYVQRTYVTGGVRYAAVYRSYTWRGVAYYHYVPAFYYRPGFYAWAYNPWPVRVAWGWGWGGAPWFGFYGYYFAPYPVYPAPSFWLTDYVLAANLQTAYADQQGAPADDGGYSGDAESSAPANTVQLSPEVKQMIADEVQRQLAAERDAAAAPQPAQQQPPASDTPAAGAPEATPSVLNPDSRVFVVSSTIDVMKDDGRECSLTAGDIIMRTGDAPDGTKVGVNVVTSKRGDCPSNTATALEVSDLEEMQNQFRQQLDSGLKALAADQGKNGMPGAPDTTTTAGEAPPPPPDPAASADLTQQQKNADQAETEVQKAPGQPN